MQDEKRANPRRVLPHEQLIEGFPDAVLVLEEGGSGHLLANAAATRLLGYSRDELLALDPVDASAEEPHRREAVTADLRRHGEWRGSGASARRTAGSSSPRPRCAA